jgi:NTP pyrophosphatase (non-canonical NTP hydrolase)
MLEKNGLVKLVEECGELTQVAAKKMTRMDSDEHWDGEGSLKTRLEAEAGDVLAAIEIVAQNFDLNSAAIMERKERKLALFREWMQESE